MMHVECMCCKEPMEIDYEPRMCCDGRDCGCYGLPIDPILCDECDSKLE